MNPHTLARGLLLGQVPSLEAPTAAAGIVALAAWAVYLPLGLRYAAFFLLSALALWLLRQQGLSLIGAEHTDSPWRRNSTRLIAAWLVLALLSCSWTVAPPAMQASSLWYGLLLLWMPLLAQVLSPALAQIGLAHFRLASGAVALIILVHHALPDSTSWLAAVAYPKGNQRVGLSIWLCLGAAMSLLHAIAHRMPPGIAVAGRLHPAVLSALNAVLVAAALFAQDRRSGMVLLPLLLFILAVQALRQLGRRTLAALLVALTAATLAFSVLQVQQRLQQDMSELQAIDMPLAEVSTSWGMRMQMWRISADMVFEAPWFGHGAGSWAVLWNDRTPEGSALHINSTPHSDYLLLAVQNGLVGAALLLVGLGLQWLYLWRGGLQSASGLLPLSGLLVSALFNVSMRDAKLLLPFITLIALGCAARVRPDAVAPSGQR